MVKHTWVKHTSGREWVEGEREGGAEGDRIRCRGGGSLWLRRVPCISPHISPRISPRISPCELKLRGVPRGVLGVCLSPDVARAGYRSGHTSAPPHRPSCSSRRKAAHPPPGRESRPLGSCHPRHRGARLQRQGRRVCGCGGGVEVGGGGGGRLRWRDDAGGRASRGSRGCLGSTSGSGAGESSSSTL